MLPSQRQFNQKHSNTSERVVVSLQKNFDFGIELSLTKIYQNLNLTPKVQTSIRFASQRSTK